MADATNERRNFFNFRHRKADGTIRDVEVYSTPIRLNVATTLFAIIHDVTERNQIAAALQESEARYGRVVDGTDEGYWEWNLVTQAVTVSARFEAMLGYTPGEWVRSHENWLRHVHPDDVEPSMRLFEKHLQGESPHYSNAFRMKTKLGQWIWIQSKGKVASRDADGKATLISGTHTDITRQRTAEDALKVMNNDFVKVLESSSDFMYFKDRDSRIRYCSQTMATLTGYTSWRDMVGKHDLEIFPPETAEIYQKEEAPIFAEGIPLLNKIDPYIKPDGSRGWVSTNKWPLFADDGNTVEGLFGISRDVTDAKRHEEDLLVIATTDFLTGVESRRSFVGAVDYEIARIQRDSSCQCAILMFDLDHFKKVNDTYGHATGDEVLKHITKIMGSEIRKVDRIGRLGGEEFAILMPGTDMTSAQTFAERLRQEVETTPISKDGQSIVVTVSIGLSALKGSDDSSGPALKRVDQALYKAKSHGRNRVEVLTEANDLIGS
jgi:diguanylate cyclase (GGDEF)-like protein/PAS domain S-box-containing protein